MEHIKISKLILGFCVLLVSLTQIFAGRNLPESPYSFHEEPKVQDTIPLQPRTGDFINDSQYNPFDIQPSNLDQQVEYDPETGNYLIFERIGDEYYRTPTYMTFDEYLDWRGRQQEYRAFQQMAGVNVGNTSSSGKVDPMANIDIQKNLIDRLFGGNEITIEPQGNVDLTFGGDYYYLQNPTIPRYAQRQWGFNFDMDIKLNVEGNIGDKMNLGFNFDSQATFDFDNKIKLAYDSEEFSEDEILKKIEAGNVSLPLRSSLIQGSQSLFGIKTELQFGRLRLTAIASQQNSQQEELTIESGGLTQEFEIYPDQYDENRHFFLSYFNRSSFEEALSTLPQIKTSFRITKLQVWVTNDRNETDNLKNIAALADLGVGIDSNLTNPLFVDINPVTPKFLDYTGQHVLSDNRVNDLYENLQNDDQVRDLINTRTQLENMYGLQQGRDFEVLKARLLNASEYTYHPELGFISLNLRLRPNQVLAVSYQYSYTYNGGEVYQVGEMANDGVTGDTSRVIFTQLLKSTTQNPDEPNWDLMMKNVYPLGAAQVSQEDFKLDIFYEDNSDGTLKRYIPEDGFFDQPLLDVFNLDRLNSVGDPQQDGIFDFVPGVTIIPRNGSIIFPVLEPFGSSLRTLLDDEALFQKFAYQELYDLSITNAREQLHKNRFVLKGEYKSAISSEISLGAWNIPPGSVTVRAGSQILIPGQDYDIDYGIGRIKILNEAYLQQGVPLRVSYEDNSAFSLQTKTMLGTRADYMVNKNFNIGGTYLHLFERPYSEKVNLGEDPINNRIYGLDMDYSDELPWLTRALDRLPFYSTKEMSNLSLAAEVAALRPGHARAINGVDDNGGVVYIDDFEGASSSIPIGYLTTEWALSATPSNIELPENELSNQLEYNYNRAHLNWYRIDRSIRTSSDESDSYTRTIDQRELFPLTGIQPGQITDLQTFDLFFDPTTRGPYNFDPPNGSLYSAGSFWDSNDKVVRLNNPEERWGGVMRYLNNNDFEATNVEYIEFWLMNPFLDRRDGTGHDPDEEGYLYFNLGNVSEDILKDNLQFYENGLPVDGEMVPIQETVWGNIPSLEPKVNSFDLNKQDQQDLGFDGLTDMQERDKFQDYVSAITAVSPDAFNYLSEDPANDNFVYFEDSSYNGVNNVQTRYSKFNGVQGNFPDINLNQRGGDPDPDAEDLNKNQSLDSGESYYEYKIKIKNTNGEIADEVDDYITEVNTIKNPNTNEDEKWYRFRIPISEGTSIGGIQGYRSIQFIRMYMKGFKTDKTLRFAKLEFARNQWRRLLPACHSDGNNPTEFTIDAVGYEENNNKTPFNYVLPKGIKRVTVYNNYANIPQDEKSLALRFCNLEGDESEGAECMASVYKLTRLDLRVFERLQMFVHAESIDPTVTDGDLSLVLRVGKDFLENYYEYEIPLVLSDPNQPGAINDPEEIWREENSIDVLLSKFTNAKIERNATGTPFSERFEMDDPDKPGAKIRILGNPSLGYVKGLQVGVKNSTGSTNGVCGEVWINELRASGLDERGGVAGIARMDIQMADLGGLTMSGAYNSIGWGALDQKLDQRSKEEVFEYDVATNLELGKFLPQSLGLNIPMYAQFANITKTPQFDPYDLDLTLKEKLAAADDPEEQADIKERALDVTNIKTVNFTNVKKNRGTGPNAKKGRTPMPWDLANFSASYAYTQTVKKDPIIQRDQIEDQRGSLDYNFRRTVKYIQPFKKINNKHLKIIKEFNFNPLPNSFAFNTELKRLTSVRTYRLPEEFDYTFYDQRFNWDRRYDLNWDLAKSLRFSFTADNIGVVDELRQVGLESKRRFVDERGAFYGDIEDVSQKQINNYMFDNLRDLGRTKSYSHNIDASYTLPFKHIPALSWVTVRANYNAGYAFDAASLNIDSLGNVIQNNQTRQLNATLNFEKLYGSSKYLKQIDRPGSSNSKRRPTSRKNSNSSSKKGGKNDKEKKERQVTQAEKIILRPLLLLREAKLTYQENLSTVVPGFINTPSYVGMTSDFSSPGWDFIAGWQPDFNINNSNNWLNRAANQNWITTSRFLNQQVAQSNNQSFEARIKLEPFRDFDIDINFKKTYNKNHTEEFKNLGDDPMLPQFEQLALRDVGSFEITYYALNTLFNGDINGLFSEFENNRTIISSRLDNIENPGPHDIDDGYTKGYGRQADNVLIPAFLAAYTGEDPNTIAVDLEREISDYAYLPKPNWSVNYKGLSKLPWFKDIFSNVSLTHSYKSTLRVNAFTTDPLFAPQDPFGGIEDLSGNYFSRVEIPQILISEQFSPIIGVSIKTKSNIDLRFDYKKSRQLALSLDAKELVEGRTTELVFGFDYTLENYNIGWLTGNKTKKSNSRTKKSKSSTGSTTPGRGTTGGSSSKSNDLSFGLDFSFRDDGTWNHSLDVSRSAEATRGTTTLRINPNVEYDVNKNLSLRLFVDYAQTTPKTTNSYPSTNANGGVTVRFKLN